MLDARQRRFVDEYLVDLNARAAATRAGYSAHTARVTGPRILKYPEVAAAIEAGQRARSERVQVKADQVLEELTRVAFSDMREFAKWGADGVTLKQCDELGEDVARCVSEVSETKTKDGGSLRFRLHDKVAALTLLGRHLGMFKDVTRIEGELPPLRVVRDDGSGGGVA